MPTRFVRACPKGHVDDLDWRGFVHGPGTTVPAPAVARRARNRRRLGRLASCAASAAKPRGMHEAADPRANPLGHMPGRAAVARSNSHEGCAAAQPAADPYGLQRLFPSGAERAVAARARHARSRRGQELWDDLQIVDDSERSCVHQEEAEGRCEARGLQRRRGACRDRTMPRADGDRAAGQAGRARRAARCAGGLRRRRPDRPRLPRSPAARSCLAPLQLDATASRRSSSSTGCARCSALIGFTRFEAVTPDINGEYETDVDRAELALEPQWFPAVENRGEGHLRPSSTATAVARLAQATGRQGSGSTSSRGSRRWASAAQDRAAVPGRPVRAAPHPLAPADPVRRDALRLSGELDPRADLCRFGRAAVRAAAVHRQPGRRGHARRARGAGPTHRRASRASRCASGGLCSNDPVCAQHSPGEGMEDRWLHGAACHGCALIAETSCEMRNDYLDRALVVPTLAVPDAAFFRRRCRDRAAARAAGARARAARQGARDRACSRRRTPRPPSARRVGGAADRRGHAVARTPRSMASGIAAGAVALALRRGRRGGDACAAARPRLVRPGRARAPRARHAAGLRGAGRCAPALALDQHLRLLRRPEGVQNARRADDWPCPSCSVSLLLNIQRRHGDVPAGRARGAVRRAPVGARLARTRRRPRSSTTRARWRPRHPGGVLHAKAIVADEQAAFVTSANLTEAAFDRNIEVGVLSRDRNSAASLARHFRTLIEQGLLLPLPSG